MARNMARNMARPVFRPIFRCVFRHVAGGICGPPLSQAAAIVAGPRWAWVGPAMAPMERHPK
ncbi:MAG: hypothetical protein EBU97_05155 [Rhodobacteraceae bacterium]|nr:hypothetical protein [Paracoccaceae bacterium]